MEEEQTAGERAEHPPLVATATASQSRVLVAYATRHGSTKDVADAVAEELRASGIDADVQDVKQAANPAAYDAVIVGGPMIRGWHKDALEYVRCNAAALRSRPLAVFITAASLTETNTEVVEEVPIFKDPWLVKQPRQADKLRYKERYARPEHYLGDIVQRTGVRPQTAAFFGGSLDLTTMSVFDKLFVLVIVGAKPGDQRNWRAIRGWAREVAPTLLA
jgi:menaquinone-dependent protoporphyrinogen oxidase